MDMEQAMVTRLLASPAIVEIVGDRVFWVERPQGSDYPAITLQHVVDERRQSMTGFDGLQPANVQADGWALTYEAGKALKEALIDTLTPRATVENVTFDRAFVTARDLSASTATAFIHRPSLDFSFFYSVQ